MMLVKGSLVRLILAIGLCSVLVGEAVGGDDKREEDSSKLDNYILRLRANAFVIQELGQRLERIRKKLRQGNFSNVRHVHEIVENAVSHLESKNVGYGCKDNEFQCDSRGHSERQCVSELLACDGTKDCFNGHDEDPNICRISQLRPGTSFSGFFAKTEGCMINTRHAYSCRIIIASHTRSKMFPALMTLEIQSECTVHLGAVIGASNNTKVVKSRAVGPYSVGNRRWSTSVGLYSSECYFTDSFRAMWCNSRQGPTSCANRLFYYRDD